MAWCSVKKTQWQLYLYLYYSPVSYDPVDIWLGWERRNAYRILVGKPVGNIDLEYGERLGRITLR
jgi:hypothetical protein